MNVAPLTSLREAGTSPAARHRAIRRPALSHVLIALAVILAFVFNFLALQDRSETQLVAVVEQPVVAGSVLTPGDIRFVPIGSNFEGLSGLVTEDAWPGLEGWVVNRSIAAGVPLDIGSLSEPVAGGGLGFMSIPVAIEHAAGGLLQVGDRVDVISILDGGPEFVATGLSIVSLGTTDRSGLGGLDDYHIVVAVTPSQALSLAAAIEAGSLEVIRATGLRAADGGGGAGS